MKNLLWKSQSGAVTAMIALMLTVMLGFLGFAIDIGNFYFIRTRMQNAVDAAVCGGGLLLPNTTQATTEAQSLINSNISIPNTTTISFTQDPAKNPGNAPEINCSITCIVPTYFISLFGIPSVAITVSAEAISQQSGGGGGPFDYTIFSGSPTQRLILNGSQIVKGSIHANDDVLLNGSSDVSGAVEGAHGVNINGAHDIGSVMADTVDNIHINGANNIGSQSGGATNIDMPDYSQQIIDIAAQVYNSNKTFNGSVNIDGSIYVNGNVILNGSISSTGAILATGNITVNGASSISGSNQVCLYSANGNVIVNGASFYGNTASAIIYAPHGSITINGSMVFHGRIIGNRVIINGSENINGEDYPVTSLPMGKNHVKLIK